MIILDTNVLSEILRPKPSSKVLEWIGSHPSALLFTTSITEAELLYGIALLPDGKRRRALEVAVGLIFTDDLAGRVLPFDSAAAREYASQVAREIMKAREVERRHWKIAVQDDAGTAVSEVLFATVDPTLDHLPRYQRTELERLAGNVAALKAIAYESRLLVLRSRAIMARLSRRPVARKGRQAARPSRPLCSWFRSSRVRLVPER